MNIQKFSKISKVTQAALLSLSLATFFCACTGTNVAGTDEHENSIADGNNPNNNPDKDSENVPQHGNNGSSSSTPSSSSIAIEPQSSSSINPSTGSNGSDIDSPIVGKNDLDELLEAASTVQALGEAVDCVCGTFITAKTELGVLKYASENHYQQISCTENNENKAYYSATKEFEAVIKVFYSTSTEEHEIFKGNCQVENGSYNFADNKSKCTLPPTTNHMDPNWVTMKDLVISHCME